MWRKAVAAAAGVFVLAACAPRASFGQADPHWLRSWNEAQKSRPAVPASRSRIAAADEPGTPLLIHGQVLAPDGRSPAADVIVHAYHRDQQGFDFGPGDISLPTWRLQGWARTDADGRFEFRTIRPAPDHLGREAAHVHFTLESKSHGRQWAPTIYLADDPRVTDGQRRQSAAAEDFGWVVPVRSVEGVQDVTIRLRLKERGEF